MAYCLDANTFIEAKNRYYGLDFCPAFWDWLDREAEGDELLCVRAIYDEIAGGGDDLAGWVRARNGHKWLCRIDAEEVQTAFQAVVRHVEGRRGHYTDDAITRFMAGADPWLIAYCLAFGHTLVTHERADPNAHRVVKIPDVCAALGVACIDGFQLIRDLNARFVLE